ncbi:hypothetical protein [Streptomyces sp. NPDC001717]|uniref:hypothetical protein n=1 Tax=Streptomyces sp. NPDC001717 TaxID=3364604 RepID=UPI00369F6E49
MNQPLDKDLAERQKLAAREIESVVNSFRDNPDVWREIREQVVNAKDDEERVKLLVDFATSEGALSRLAPKTDVGPVAATPTVTTVTVTTVTTV